MLFHEMVIDSHPTGSRYICDPPVMDTDNDTLVLVNPYHEYRQALIKEGWVQEGKGYEGGEFMSWRKDKENYIVTEDADFYFAFLVATETSKRLNLRMKDERVKLHQAVRDSVMTLRYAGIQQRFY